MTCGGGMKSDSENAVENVRGIAFAAGWVVAFIYPVYFK